MKTDLELRHLRVFVGVVEMGSHTRAAQSLGLSQSTVSETLSALERTLGTSLFRKAVRGMQLTPSGEALLPHARRMLALSSELVSEVARVSSEVSAVFVVSAVESLSAYVLPSRLAALRARWPRVRVEVSTAVCAQIRESVAAGKSDLGLTIEADTGVADESILANARLVIFGPPGHSLTKKPASPEALHDCVFYMSDAGGDYHQVLRQFFEAAQLTSPRTEVLGSVEGVKRGIMAGTHAVGLLPAYAVAQELRDGTLAEVRTTRPLPGLVLRVAVASGTSSPVVDDLIESLRDLRQGWTEVK